VRLQVRTTAGDIIGFDEHLVETLLGMRERLV
jgi:hypothetical protein